MIGGISGWQLLILLLIVVLVFGTKRLRNIGGDLGNAVKSFRQGMGEEDKEPEKLEADEDSASVSANAQEADTDPAGRPPGSNV